MTAPTYLLLAATAGLLLPLSACATEDASTQDCSGAKCDTLLDFDDRLDGREDPIAKFLRTLDVDQRSQVSADFGTFAEGIAEMQGCDKTTWKSFVVSDAIVEGTAFPRVVSTVCSDNPRKASEFFIAASFKDPNSEDIDPSRIEMFAWDAKTREYRFYASESVGESRIEIEIDPERCTECHLTPSNLPSGAMRMTPIMNELTQPWSHWNSEVPMFSGRGIPFRNHDFEVPQEVRTGRNFLRYGGERIGAAQELEAIIREGHDRVGLARTRDKRITTEDWRPAMNLMRPLFCTEQVNYTTEDFQTGLVRVSALIPGGLREAYRAERPDNWAWDWVNNDGERVRLPVPENEAPLVMLPVRGNADIGFENRLMTPRASAVFTPQQIVQISALDWQRPVFSDFRCGLWKDALARFENQAPTIAVSGKTNETMRELYPQILNVDGVAIDSGDPLTFVALAKADDASIAAMLSDLSSDSVASTCESDAQSCRVDLDSFGVMLNTYVTSFTQGDADTVRKVLRVVRDLRLCHVAQFFPNAPGLPSFACEEPTEPDAGFSGSNDEDVAITDNGPDGVTSNIEARGADALPLKTVEVRVEIEHSWRGDLLIELSSPSGQTQEVQAFESGDSDDNVSERFTVAGFTQDEDSRGVWSLRVTDRASQDTGTLLEWSLGINSAAP